MGDERPRHRAAGDGLHHRRFHLEVAARVEKLAQRRQHPAAHLEHLARLGIDDEIEIALAIADLDVGQTVPLLRQRQMAFCKKLDPRRPDRQLVGARSEQMPLHADEVAEIEEPEQLEVALRQRILPDVDLNPRSAVRQNQKIRFAEAADAENAAARCGVYPGGLRARVRLLSVRAHQVGNRRAAIESMRIGVDAKLAELRQVGAALLDLFVFRRHSPRSYRTGRPENGFAEVFDEQRLGEALRCVPAGGVPRPAAFIGVRPDDRMIGRHRAARIRPLVQRGQHRNAAARVALEVVPLVAARSTGAAATSWSDAPNPRSGSSPLWMSGWPAK